MEHTYGTLCKTDHKTTKYVLTNLRGLKSYQLLFNHNGMKQKSITKVKQEKKYFPNLYKLERKKIYVEYHENKPESQRNQ